MQEDIRKERKYHSSLLPRRNKCEEEWMGECMYKYDDDDDIDE